MRPSRRILLPAIAVLLVATALGAQGSVPAGYQTQSSTQLAPGVDHEALSLADPAQSVHVARVAPGAARLVAVSSHDAVANQGAGGELPGEMCRRVGCFAGINADFRDGAGEPAGGVVSGGRLLRSPVPGRAQLIVTRDGHLQAAPLDWSGSVTASDGRSVPVGGVNVDPNPGVVTLYTPAWGGDTPDGADTELIVRAGAGAVGAIGATPLEIVGVRSDAGPVPADGAVLAASGSAAATLHELADLSDAGRISRTLSLRIRTTVDVVESVGGNPTVLRDGHPAFPDAGDSFTADRHARSLVGWNPAGEVVLVTVDAGRDGASGMSLAEAADLLTGLGATDGFGFDGESATFVASGAVQNMPPDGEHPAANTLMVVPNLPDPPPSSSGSGGSGGAGSNPGSSGTTATAAPAKVTVAGGGSAPSAGTLASPASPAPSTALPSTVHDILSNSTTKRARHLANKDGKGHKAKDAQGNEVAGDPSIPDWNTITAALTPEAVANGDQPEELSLAAGAGGHHGPGHDPVRMVLDLSAAGLIATVLWGLQRARAESRPRPALWL
jgi:hypothetical protein